MTGKDYKVGYGRPPLGTRFRKGASGNPSGGKRKETDLDELLSGDVTVIENGKLRTVESFQAELYAIAKRALEGNSFPHLKRLLDVFRKYDVAPKSTSRRHTGVVHLPNLPRGLCDLLIARHGFPPWSEEQIYELRPVWVALRDEREEVLDELGYYKW